MTTLTSVKPINCMTDLSIITPILISSSTLLLPVNSALASVSIMSKQRGTFTHQDGLQHSITLGRPPGHSALSDAVLAADIAAVVSHQGGTAPLPTATTLSRGACLQLSIGLKVILLSMLQVLSTNSNLCAKLEDTAIITSGHSLFSSGRVQHNERSISMNHLSFKQSEHATVYALSLDIPSTYSCHHVYSAHPSSLISSTHAS